MFQIPNYRRNGVRHPWIPALLVTLLGLTFLTAPGNATAQGPLGRLFHRGQNRCAVPAYVYAHSYDPQQQYCWELRSYYGYDVCGRCVLTSAWFLVPCTPVTGDGGPGSQEPNPPKVDVDGVKNIKINGADEILARKFPWLKRGSAASNANAAGVTPSPGTATEAQGSGRTPQPR